MSSNLVSKGLIIMRENADLVMANDKRFLFLYCGWLAATRNYISREIDET